MKFACIIAHLPGDWIHRRSVYRIDATGVGAPTPMTMGTMGDRGRMTRGCLTPSSIVYFLNNALLQKPAAQARCMVGNASQTQGKRRQPWIALKRRVVRVIASR